MRYRYSKNVVSLQGESHPVEDMARKKKDAEKSADVLALEARLRELELQNLALNMLIDVAEKTVSISEKDTTLLQCYAVTVLH